MAYVIGSKCEKCGQCVEACPTEAIHPSQDEDDFEKVDMLFIDPEGCVDCGTCVDECPVQAIFPEDELPADQKEYIQKASDFYAGR